MVRASKRETKRALFVVGDDPPSTNNLIAALLCRDATTQVGFEDFLEEENILTEVSLKKKKSIHGYMFCQNLA